ncbi:Udp-glycosyltransferase 73d1 [Thalictrum thalictroides]|uniref:Glycosyltransferase n=1 Tax=Thalictrum thalictroides TaxID=46969 RepID=A0A7J6W2A2_THATH|nr:Udp-glycosyltransferase 73d1 [Thalictrum thalictroides]
MAQGHLIPMVDMARLISERGIMSTIVTTPLNACRFKTTIDRAVESGLPIRLLVLQLRCTEMGLPEGCENLDSAPSRELIRNFLLATNNLQGPLEQYLQESQPRPSCIISDKYLPWTSGTANKFKIPRLVFHGMCCFSLLCSHNILYYYAHENITSHSKTFIIPGMPEPIEIPKAQLPGEFMPNPDLDDIRDQIREAESMAYGVVVNSFNELELSYIREYQNAIQKKVWCIGPVSQCNKNVLDKFDRGDKASIDKNECLRWLNSKKPKSVIYVCLGSQCRLIPSQLIELGHSLNASNYPFIWVIKRTETFHEFENWLSGGFEEQIKERGLLIKGWAPQIFILSHPAIGGFLTHCGWNSTLEGICAGIPMITWPLFAEQFLNEKLIVQVMGIGVRIGVDVPVRWGDEEKSGVKVKREQIQKAIERLMNEEEEGARKRARDLGEIAIMSMETGYSNMTLMIEDIMQLATSQKLATI